jgi:ribosomal protein S12 methylthiotransferase accessory factor
MTVGLSTMDETVLVAGDGPLADPLRTACAGRFPVALDIVVHGTYRVDGVEETITAAYGGSRPLLFVQVEPGAVTIGALTVPGERGCQLCLLRRQDAARAVAAEGERELWAALARGDTLPAPPPLAASLVEAVAAVVTAECAALHQSQPAWTRGAVVAVDPFSLAVSRHRFLPDPVCPVCGDLPDDNPAAAALALQPRRKSAPDRYRLRDLTPEHGRLLDTYVDPRCGLVPSVSVTDIGATLAGAVVGIPGGEPAEGWGRTGDYQSSATVAIAEALERLGGVGPRNRRITVRGSFTELGPDRAIDPASLGLPAEPPNEHGRYTPELALEWVYGYSFRRGGPVLVPATIGYYGYTADPRIAYECSNGCALGSCLEDAILSAIFEVVERDAFLMSWYARLPVPRIDPASSTDPVNRMLASRIERDTGCRLHVFDATMPERIPALFAMLVDEQDRPGVAKACVCAGAHLDPERALRSALLELGSGHDWVSTLLRRDPDRARRLVADSDQVVTLDDHPLVQTVPESWPRLAFLFRRGDVHGMAEAFPADGRYVPADDLLVDLRHVVGRILEGGLDVVVVDQTTDEHRAADLWCVKVIVPGMLPMTFGHRNRRTNGLPRLRTVPVRLGYRGAPLPEHEINSYPHPFP